MGYFVDQFFQLAGRYLGSGRGYPGLPVGLEVGNDEIAPDLQLDRREIAGHILLLQNGLQNAPSRPPMNP